LPKTKAQKPKTCQSAEIIREFVEKIYVRQKERIDGQKVQRIRIVWNCIGEFTPPKTSENEKSA